jgi:hypothetical protein
MPDGAVTDLTRGVYRRLYGGFITGQRINKLSLNAEAWFWRVLVAVDDFGNGRADPELCKAATAGSRRVTARQVSGWLREMRDVGLIQFYTVKGEPLLHVVGFEENQPAGKNGKRFKRFATPDESGCIQVNPGFLNSSLASEIINDTENTNESTPSSKPAPVVQVFEFWKTEMGHPKAQLTPERKKKIEERLKDSTVEEIQTAIRGCKRSDFHMGREPGKPQVFDDIELICRKRSKLEHFIALAPVTNGRPAKAETDEERKMRESCTRCFSTGTENVPGKGARACRHGRANETTGVISSGSDEGKGSPADRGVRVS